MPPGIGRGRRAVVKVGRRSHHPGVVRREQVGAGPRGQEHQRHRGQQEQRGVHRLEAPRAPGQEHSERSEERSGDERRHPRPRTHVADPLGQEAEQRADESARDPLGRLRAFLIERLDDWTQALLAPGAHDHVAAVQADQTGSDFGAQPAR